MFQLFSYSDAQHRDVQITDKFERVEGPIKTLFIGENATGKTRFLTSLIEKLRRLNDLKKDGKELKSLGVGEFALRYRFGRNTYSVISMNNQVELKRNDKDCLLSDLELPNGIIAVTATYNDKFSFAETSRDVIDFYSYCGIREAGNASWTSSLSRKTIENLFEIATDEKRKALALLFAHLGLEPKFFLKFKVKRMLLSLDQDSLYKYIKAYSNRRRMQVDLFSGFTKNAAENLYANIQSLNLVSGSNQYVADIRSHGNIANMDSYQAIDFLRRVDLIENIELGLYKNGQEYPYISSSSGETQLLYSFSSIIRHSRPNTLIVIDEPEVSLHPNWQIKYMALLTATLKTIKGCHILIASHSHFLVSDLDSKNSSLVVFRRHEGKMSHQLITESTYAWSPESILYNVFGVRTVGNPYFERDLNRALAMISEESQDKDKLLKLHEKLKPLVFDENDPLQMVLESIESYVRNFK